MLALPGRRQSGHPRREPDRHAARIGIMQRPSIPRSGLVQTRVALAATSLSLSLSSFTLSLPLVPFYLPPNVRSVQQFAYFHFKNGV